MAALDGSRSQTLTAEDDHSVERPHALSIPLNMWSPATAFSATYLWCELCDLKTRATMSQLQAEKAFTVSHFPGVVREALERVETLLETLFETADDAILLMDELQFVDCNPAALRMFRCSSKADIIGRTPMFFSPPAQPDESDSSEQARRYVQAALAGAPQDFEWRHWRLDHAPFDVEVKLNRCFVGGAPFLLAVVRDISFRKRLADRLLESKRFSDRLIDSLPGIFYLCDANLRLVRWSRSHAAALGYTPEDDLTGRSLESFLAGDANRNETLLAAHEILRSPDAGATTFVETELVRKDGTALSFLCSGVRINSPSGPMLLGVGFDITERKRTESERDRLVAELQGMSSVRERFLMSLSRELHRSVEAIQASLSELRQDRHVQDHQLRLNVSAIDRNVRVQARLISNLFDLSQIMGGKLSIQPTCIQLSDLLSAAVRSCRAEAEYARVSLTGQVDPGFWVNVDAARMEQVFVNLIENGLKFTPQGGQVEVVASISDHRASVTIRDTGTGIDSHLLPRIVDRFRRAEVAKASPGLGIGLLLVNSIVTLHGGSVSAHSAGLGQGSRFIVELPLCEAPAG